jgi:hypothetical protein
MDIGVHVYLDIDQQNVSFSFLNDGRGVFLQVNPPEQIFAEKMMSLARLGPVSTRYKDIYDMFYLSKVLGLDNKKLKSIFASFFNRSSRGPRDFKALRDRIASTLDSQMFEKEAKDVTNRWLNVGYEEAKETILSSLDGLWSCLSPFERKLCLGDGTLLLLKFTQRSFAWERGRAKNGFRFGFFDLPEAKDNRLLVCKKASPLSLFGASARATARFLGPLQQLLRLLNVKDAPHGIDFAIDDQRRRRHDSHFDDSV